MERGTLIAFYSYKGGTGRSMALANTACLLAQRLSKTNRRVLVMDWDLEAPGLHRFFPAKFDEPQEHERPGIVEYFTSLRALLNKRQDLYKIISASGGESALNEALPLDDFLIRDVIPGIDLIKAGKLDEHYGQLMAAFDWVDFYDQYDLAIQAFREMLISRYAYCLVDSRTGVTDISGICTTLLPEKLIAVFVPNRQNLDGLLNVVYQATEYRRLSSDLRPLAVFPLPSRMDAAEKSLRERWRDRYQSAFEQLFERIYELGACDLSEYFDDVQIPYLSYYAYGEKIAVLEERPDALSLSRAYKSIIERVIDNDFPWKNTDGHTGEPFRVFLAYAHSDMPAVVSLYQRLQESGMDPWIDRQKILPGMEWKEEIQKAVMTANAILVCLSAQSSEILFEALIEAALQKNQDALVIPVRLDDCPIPDNWRRWQYADLFRAGGYEQLLLALKRHQNKQERRVTDEVNQISLVSPDRPSAETVEAPLDFRGGALALPQGDLQSSGFERLLVITTQLATSWVGIATAYVAAGVSAVLAYQKLAIVGRDMPVWLRIALLLSVPVVALLMHGVPAIIEDWRKSRLSQITGNLRPSYFTLRPRDNEASFTRSDGVHEDICRWLERHKSSVLYLTGLSGTGKSSLLSASVLPNLARRNTKIVRVRGFSEPLEILKREILKPGAIWDAPPQHAEIRLSLERASQHIKPQRLLVVLDQFEEFLILQDTSRREGFVQLLSSLYEDPIEGLTFLLVMRSDYIGMAEFAGLPPLVQDANWKEVPPFSERAARDFLLGSGLHINETLLVAVLREASELERTQGLVRPITINLCGLVLGRFATKLPGQFRPGHLISGFLRESIFLPGLRDVAPRIIPHLITNQITRQPQTIMDLARKTTLDPPSIRGCLRMLGQSDRSIVRPLDADQQWWEISHDFLVPLLDSILAGWTTSLWKRSRSWLPWIISIGMSLAIIAASTWRTDPISDLTSQGWIVNKTDRSLHLQFSGTPPKRSIKVLQNIDLPIEMKVEGIDGTGFEWQNLKTLYVLDLNHTRVENISILSKVGSLYSIDLSYTPIADITPLQHLDNLSLLNLTATNVSDISVLENLKKLSALDISGTRVKDLAPLIHLKNLSKLSLSHTEVNDLSYFKNLKELTSLDLSGTNVSDVTPLIDTKNLLFLDLSGTRVTDVSALKSLKNLKLVWTPSAKQR